MKIKNLLLFNRACNSLEDLVDKLHDFEQKCNRDNERLKQIVDSQQEAIEKLTDELNQQYELKKKEETK